MHLLRTVPDLKHVAIHPDGMHGKTFDFAAWLRRQGYELTRPKGTTSYGGLYASVDGRTVEVYPMPGLGDVVGGNITAECKGGVLNSTHAGQTSRFRKGLNETIGQSMTAEIVEGKRQFVVVPKAPTSETLAKKISARCRKAGIEIALVDSRGNVFDVPSAAHFADGGHDRRHVSFGMSARYRDLRSLNRMALASVKLPWP